MTMLETLQAELVAALAESKRLWNEFSQIPLKKLDKRLAKKKAAKNADDNIKRLERLIKQLEKQETQQIGLEHGIDTKANQLQGVASIVTSAGNAAGQIMNPLMGEYGLLGKGKASLAATAAQLQTNKDLIKDDRGNKANTSFGFNSLGSLSSKTWLIIGGSLIVILFIFKSKKR